MRWTLSSSWLGLIGGILGSFAFVGCQDSRSCNDPPAYGSCNVEAMASLQPVDETRGCIGSFESTSGACISSVFACSRSASLAPDCVIAPDGGLYLAMVSNDSYVSGPAGWRSTHYNGYGASTPPADTVATPDEAKRCSAAMCLPSCGGEATAYATFAVCDAGSGVDAGDDDAMMDDN